MSNLLLEMNSFEDGNMSSVITNHISWIHETKESRGDKLVSKGFYAKTPQYNLRNEHG